MICRIADLYVSIPEAGGMAPRCRDYQVDGHGDIDVVIDEHIYEPKRYLTSDHDMVCYMESGRIFYVQLLRHNGMFLHASAVEYEGKAYLFSGPCGVGKSTHTRLWQQVFGPEAQVFNDDKPALRLVDGRWFAYGTPWCGKDGINQNKKVPLAGICFLKQGKENRIRKLDMKEAIEKLLSQTTNQFNKAENLDLLLGQVDKLIRMIPVFELENRPEPAAAQLSHDTMLQAALELGL